MINIISTDIIGFFFVFLLALIFGFILTYIAIKFKKEEDPKIKKIYEVLPKANCGGCGFAGCSDFSKALVEKKVAVAACPVCSSEIMTE